MEQYGILSIRITKRSVSINKLDLTVEALVLKKEYRIFFTESELEIARERLTQLGFISESKLMSKMTYLWLLKMT